MFETPENTDEIGVNKVFTLNLEIEGQGVKLPIFITSKDAGKHHVQYFGYFLDESNWYLADVFLYVDSDQSSSVVLSPMTAPSMWRPELVEYYQSRIREIPEMADNLASVASDN